MLFFCQLRYNGCCGYIVGLGWLKLVTGAVWRSLHPEPVAPALLLLLLQALSDHLLASRCHSSSHHCDRQSNRHNSTRQRRALGTRVCVSSSVCLRALQVSHAGGCCGLSTAVSNMVKQQQLVCCIRARRALECVSVSAAVSA